MSYQVMRDYRPARSWADDEPQLRAYNLAYAVTHLINSLSLRLRAGQALVTDLGHCLVLGRG